MLVAAYAPDTSSPEVQAYGDISEFDWLLRQRGTVIPVDPSFLTDEVLIPYRIRIGHASGDRRRIAYGYFVSPAGEDDNWEVFIPFHGQTRENWNLRDIEFDEPFKSAVPRGMMTQSTRSYVEAMVKAFFLVAHKKEMLGETELGPPHQVVDKSWMFAYAKYAEGSGCRRGRAVNSLWRKHTLCFGSRSWVLDLRKSQH